MASAPTAKSPANSVANDMREQSTSSPQRIPNQSDIRDLKADNTELTRTFELIRNQRRREVMTPPPFTLDAATGAYALTQSDSTVLDALRAGDLPQAVAALIQENLQLRKELESGRSDFEELRSVNVALQEQADARLAVADDQRLELLEQLERARAELSDLENQNEQMRLDHESELATLRQQRNA